MRLTMLRQDSRLKPVVRRSLCLLMILLRMVRSSLTLISMSWGEMEDGTCPGETPQCPRHPPPGPAYLPCQLSEEGLEVLINLLF